MYRRYAISCRIRVFGNLTEYFAWSYKYLSNIYLYFHARKPNTMVTNAGTRLD